MSGTAAHTSKLPVAVRFPAPCRWAAAAALIVALTYAGTKNIWDFLGAMLAPMSFFYVPLALKARKEFRKTETLQVTVEAEVTMLRHAGNGYWEMELKGWPCGLPVTYRAPLPKGVDFRLGQRIPVVFEVTKKKHFDTPLEGRFLSFLDTSCLGRPTAGRRVYRREI